MKVADSESIKIRLLSELEINFWPGNSSNTIILLLNFSFQVDSEHRSLVSHNWIGCSMFVSNR